MTRVLRRIAGLPERRTGTIPWPERLVDVTAPAVFLLAVGFIWAERHDAFWAATVAGILLGVVLLVWMAAEVWYGVMEDEGGQVR